MFDTTTRFTYGTYYSEVVLYISSNKRIRIRHGNDFSSFVSEEVDDNCDFGGGYYMCCLSTGLKSCVAGNPCYRIS